MILLDTNVLSEMRKIARGRADHAVASWVEQQSIDRLYLSTMTIMEIRIGILRLARYDPIQADHLARWLDSSVLCLFSARILSFDTDVALACASLHVPSQRPERDAIIAATARVHDLTIATRNTRDFIDTGVRLVDPWAYRVGTGSAPE